MTTRPVNARPVLGDFVDAARQQSAVSAGRRGVTGGKGDVGEVISSLLRVVVIMSRYVRDVTAEPGDVHYRVRPPLTAWGRAGMDARMALAKAAGFLHDHHAGRRRPGRRGQQRTRAEPGRGGDIADRWA